MHYAAHSSLFVHLHLKLCFVLCVSVCGMPTSSSSVLQCEFSKLQAEAAALDKPSICPVRAHIGFTMLSIQFSVIPEWWARTLCLTFAQRGQNNYKAHQSVVVNVCNVLLDQVSCFTYFIQSQGYTNLFANSAKDLKQMLFMHLQCAYDWRSHLD